MDARTLRRVFGRPVAPASFGAPLVALTRGALRLETVLRALYVFPIFWFVTHLHELRPLLDPHGLELRWPVMWMSWVRTDFAAPAVIAFGFGSATLGAFFPERRVVRALVFVGLLEVLALKFSFGKIHHLMHGWLYTTFILAVFLPDAAFNAAQASRAERLASVTAFVGAQAMLALTYSLAGFGKLLGTTYQLVLDEITPLHPSALARHVADRILQTHADSLLGEFMIENAVLIWPMMLATLYLQMFALWAVFRPHLHRLWAVGLIGFHVMTKLSMTIDFTPNVMLLGLLWTASPIAPPRLSVPRILTDLPIFGGLFSALLRRS